MVGFGKRDPPEVVGSICEETLNQRGPLSPRDGSDWEKEIHCFNVYLFYVYLMIVFRNAKSL